MAVKYSLNRLFADLQGLHTLAHMLNCKMVFYCMIKLVHHTWLITVKKSETAVSKAPFRHRICCWLQLSIRVQTFSNVDNSET